MKRTVLLAISLLLLSTQLSFSQTKELTIDDAIVGVWREYYPEYIRSAQFRPDTKMFTYIEDTVLIEKSINLKKETNLIDLAKINSVLLDATKKELRHFPSYTWENKDVIRFNNGSDIVYFNVKKNEIDKYFTLGETPENMDVCDANSMIAYTIDNNLSIMDSKGKVTSVSSERDKGIVYGQTVSRNEFGIEKGTFWSPDGNFLAFYRKDESMVTDYPIVDADKRIAEPAPVKYCMAGMKSEEVTLGIYNVSNGKINYIKTGEPVEQFLTNIAWTPDEKSILIAVLNREQNHMKLNQYNIKSGEFVKTLFEEKHDKYVEPLYPARFLPKDSDKFIWQTRKDGYSHLYLYDMNGNEISQITKGNYEVIEVYGFTADGKDLIIKANKETPIDFDIYRVNIASGAMIRITKDAGSHNATVSTDGEYIIDNFSSATVPNTYKIYNTKGKTVSTILEAENPFAEVKLGNVEVGTIKANDGVTDLYYRIVLPPDFDETKKYPAIVYVYGGPHAQLITNSWLNAGGWAYYMAQQGYIMFTLDNRGSANRGLEFENIIHRQLGTIEVQDQLTGIEYLESLGYVDMDRIGAHGWSYGGFMTTTLMCDYPDIFKVGVAGGSVINWELYEIMYGERYMDKPQDNEEGYANSNLLNKAEKLTGRLMLIHGTADPVVVWQHSLNFVQKCVEKKVLLDYFVYPGHEHNVRGLDRVHLMRTVTRYFEDHL
ncbi:MAG: DPP IV N-terminal domain-containing protein [Bacteroidales bacterium]|nr:DPP IV N-terminal domain-containing protein [Bacteroidales bacterium]MDD4216278.1 DPP IV N-terminal domain-containing protein [Bacteroidales bacterium]MDY0141579.1 DPP IV N-terminal domain-containing protein [Bacteroidales bacterium]